MLTSWITFNSVYCYFPSPWELYSTFLEGSDSVWTGVCYLLPAAHSMTHWSCCVPQVWMCLNSSHLLSCSHALLRRREWSKVSVTCPIMHVTHKHVVSTKPNPPTARPEWLFTWLLGAFLSIEWCVCLGYCVGLYKFKFGLIYKTLLFFDHTQLAAENMHQTCVDGSLWHNCGSEPPKDVTLGKSMKSTLYTGISVLCWCS